MGSTVDFLRRSMRGSKVGAEAIAPPSQRLQKQPRKGIGTLPSPSKIPPPPVIGANFAGADPMPFIPSPAPVRGSMVPPPPVQRGRELLAQGPMQVPPAPRQGFVPEPFLMRPERVPQPREMPPVQEEYPEDLASLLKEDPFGGLSMEEYADKKWGPVEHRDHMPPVAPQFERTGAQSIQRMDPRSNRPARPMEELEAQVIDDGSRVRNSPFPGDWLPEGGDMYIPPEPPGPEPEKAPDPYEQLGKLQKMFPDAAPVPRPERGDPGFYKPKLTYDEDGKAILDATPTPENFDDYRNKMLQNQFRQGLTNKQQYDSMVNNQWNRDARDFKYDDFGANVFLPLAGMFMGKGSRGYLDDKAAAMNKNLATSRNARIQERYAQQSGDKYYADMLNDLDPNTVENTIKRRNAQNGYNNSITALNNSIERSDNYDSLAARRAAMTDADRQRIDLAARKLGMSAQQFMMTFGLKAEDLHRKEANDEFGTWSQQKNYEEAYKRGMETGRHNRAQEADHAADNAREDGKEQRLMTKDDWEREFKTNQEFNKVHGLTKDGAPKYDKGAIAGMNQTFDGDNPNHADAVREARRRYKLSFGAKGTPDGERQSVIQQLRDQGIIVR